MKNKDWTLETVFLVVFLIWVFAELLWGTACDSDYAVCPGQYTEDSAQDEQRETEWRSARARGDPDTEIKRILGGDGAAAVQKGPAD